jgi:hypothetical protein
VDSDENVINFAAFCMSCPSKKKKIGNHFATGTKRCAGKTAYEELGADGRRSGIVQDWAGPLPVSTLALGIYKPSDMVTGQTIQGALQI